MLAATPGHTTFSTRLDGGGPEELALATGPPVAWESLLLVLRLGALHPAPPDHRGLLGTSLSIGKVGKEVLEAACAHEEAL